MEHPYVVQAEYSFRGGNNDELCFKKGDIITVTQQEEGGWWEGTLGDKTGWFPSNYVNEYKVPLPLSDIIRPPEEIQEYRSVVFKDLLESERAHVAELQGLLENFLEPLQGSQILSIDEYAQLMCNFTEVVQTHEELLEGLEDCNDRVGKLFITKAHIMKTVHQAYCATHPRAIVILDKYKDELESFMQKQGAASPGLLVLTTGLSKPFRRLDKYSAMLQELERHMENCHPDRGDTQRSVAVYKDIAATCSATRRQKELELQVLTGPVRGWQGKELSTLGDIIHMGSVAVGLDHRDRYFVLFPQTLLILSVSQRMSAFIYEGKLPLTGIVVNRLADTDSLKNAFEISGPLIEKIVAVCQGLTEANKWVDLLTSKNLTVPINIKRNVSSSTINVPQLPPHMSPPANLGITHPTKGTPPIHQPSQHKRSLSFNHHLSYNQYHQHHQLQNHQNLQAGQQNHKLNLVPTSNNITKVENNLQAPQGSSGKIGSTRVNWSITNLHSASPLRPNLLNSTGSSNPLSNYSCRKTQPTHEEDALVLRVIEAYCAAYQNNARNTIHSEIRILSGEPSYKSVNLTWEIDSTPRNDSEKMLPFRPFIIFYCEIQTSRPHRCRSKNLEENSIAKNDINKQYSTIIDNLRMATQYSFHIKSQPEVKSEIVRGRSDKYDNKVYSGSMFNEQTIIIPTKGFSAQATKCLPHVSEIEIETGPYFGGKIVVDGGNCGINGNSKDPREKYTMRIDHAKCGSIVKPELNTVETFITVQENLGIFTHSTRRFVVICTFQSTIQTVRASFIVPGKDGVLPISKNISQDIGRIGRDRQFRMVDKRGLIFKEPSNITRTEQTGNADAKNSIAIIKDINPGIKKEVKLKIPSDSLIEEENHFKNDVNYDATYNPNEKLNYTKKINCNYDGLIIGISLSIILIGIFVYILKRQHRRRKISNGLPKFEIMGRP